MAWKNLNDPSLGHQVWWTGPSKYFNSRISWASPEQNIWNISWRTAFFALRTWTGWNRFAHAMPAFCKRWMKAISNLTPSWWLSNTYLREYGTSTLTKLVITHLRLTLVDSQSLGKCLESPQLSKPPESAISPAPNRTDCVVYVCDL